MSLNRVNELVLGGRGVTADTALRLARRFKTTQQMRGLLSSISHTASIAFEPFLKLVQEVLHFGDVVFKTTPRSRHVHHEPLSLHGILK